MQNHIMRIITIIIVIWVNLNAHPIMTFYTLKSTIRTDVVSFFSKLVVMAADQLL